MFERFTKDARRVVLNAYVEAERLGHDHIGGEHLLIGVAAQEGDPAARALGSLGLGVDELRDAVSQADRGDGLDAEALETIGIDLDEVRRRVEDAFGPGALGRARRRRDRHGFTKDAKRALELSLREAIALQDRHIAPEHVLLGVMWEEDSPAVEAIGRRGVTAKQVRAAVVAERERRGAA